MANDPPEGFYCRYLRQLGERRVAEGKPPASDNDDKSYWREREKWRTEATNELPLGISLVALFTGHPDANPCGGGEVWE